MVEKRIQFNNIVKNQLPEYVREEFPLVSEFLSQYYISQEFQGAPVDLIQNIDQYSKLDNNTNQIDYVILSSSISFIDDTIAIDLEKSSTGTKGFPESYGLLQIDDEIITYTGKTSNTFTGCIRGFSGITSHKKQNRPDELVFSQSESAEHSAESKILNLSSLFLKEFLSKLKYQLTPGFENRDLDVKLDQSNFIRHIKDFYSVKGTNESFKILFKALYGENVSIIKPKEQLFRPSDAQYRAYKSLVVESVSGNPYDLTNSTLFQDEYGDITKSYAPITSVEKISSELGSYYKLNLDSGYNRDLIVDGAIYGNFSIHPKTKLIGNVSTGSSILDVDSTIGFPQSGELKVLYSDNTIGIVSYHSKSINQFFDCTNITNTILDESNIGINTYAYGKSSKNSNETITIQIRSVLSNLNIEDDTYYLAPGNTGKIKTLGVNEKNAVSNNWLFNISPSYDVESVLKVNNSDYKITTKDSHIFRLGDIVTITNSSGVKKSATVLDVFSNKIIKMNGQGTLSTTDTYTIKRNILKSNISSAISNVQNVYKIKDRTLIASSSIPYYIDIQTGSPYTLTPSDKSIIFSGTFGVGVAYTDIFKITSNTDHGFYTGDAIYYNPRGSRTSSGSLFNEGLYFIKREDSNNIRFAKSRSDIFNSNFERITTSKTVSSNKLELQKFNSKIVSSQNLLREISPPVNDGYQYETNPGKIGILINGVEILNYKSTDNISYGALEEINVVSSGFDYDIINPPILNINDSVGTGATGYCAITGNLKEIRIIDPGFDYLQTPIIKITGGNGIGAKAEPNMKLITHQSVFNSNLTSQLVGIGTTISTIGFTTYHKFRNAEQVIYKTDGQTSVGGLSTDSTYYVNVQTPYTIKLHNTFDDAVVGVNTITLSSYGIGNHTIQSYNKKSIIGSISVINSGSGYENKKRTTGSSGINTSLGLVYIKNHDYKSGEIVTYTNDDAVIGGLQNNTNYYVSKVNDNQFKLSQIGVGLTNQDFYYTTNQYIDFSSVGSGTHTFNYPNILVEIIGNVGISSVSGETFQSKIQPIFRGTITSFHLTNGGVGYGSSEILNYYREPNFTLDSGSDAILTPVVSIDGKIVDVIINKTGNNYNSAPKLYISGVGNGAVLTPIIQNGQIVSVNIIESGVNYTQETTKIEVISSGTKSVFKSKIQTWKVNLFQKYFKSITDDDGIISEGLNSEYGLEYTHLYAPRKLREILYASDSGGNILYKTTDLKKVNGSEISSTDHSPIIGWAYDGNPIYGPYGYLKNQGGKISQMKSGYKIDLKENRPPVNDNFPVGFFVEDYTYYNRDDETVLDENNGRYCITPEFPNGTYAYFVTINNILVDSSGPFIGYKQPTFPYIIGNNFRSKPIDFNFDKLSNQKYIDLNKTQWMRNTYPYNLIDENSSYPYLNIPNKLNQTVDIKSVSPGAVENVGIVTGGNDYKVDDSITFNNENLQGGYGASAKVSRIYGKHINTISVATSSISNVEIYPTEEKGNLVLFTQSPHNFKDSDIISISGLNTTSSLLEAFYTVGVTTNTLTLISSTGNLSSTGIITYFSVSGNLSYKNIRENDILGIGTEKVQVLSIDERSSRIKVLRGVNGSVGSSHTASSLLFENSKRLNINVGFSTLFDYKTNKEIYLNPIESIGIGTKSDVGIGTTISFSNPGVGITQIFIPTKSIYIPYHNLETGDILTYSVNGGSPLVVSQTGIGTTTLENNSTVYVAKISNSLIGISTVKVGLGSTGTFVGIATTTSSLSTLYFTGLGTGVNHSFKTNYLPITGKISRNLITVSTAQTHGLLNGDTVFVDVNPSISTTFTINYNDYNRRLVVNPNTFLSAGISTVTNTITIPNHGYVKGQKIIHTSSLPSIGLQSNKIYYAVIVDENNIKLSNTYFNSISPNPEIVGISSASFGTISAINLPIKVYKDSTVTFDLSDSSLSYNLQGNIYSAFILDFYKDSNFTEKYTTSEQTNLFEIARYGSVGITNDAKVILTVNQYLPEKLYYKLNPIYENQLPSVKQEIVVDDSIHSNNEIQIHQSKYNGEYQVSVASSISFTYTSGEILESDSYSSSSSKLEYQTNSKNCSGTISNVEITNKGKNYYTLPTLTNITSTDGYGALLEASSKSIGKVNNTKINDIGFDFPCDFTVKPSVQMPQVIKVEPLASFESIKVSSFGRGYTVSPKLIVIDGKTNRIASEVDLKYTLGDNNVKILKNTYGLNNITPKIIPIQNSNGVGISSIQFNSTSKDVTVTLSVGFSVANDFPFKVNDKVLIENVSVGIESTGKGFNSENYNYSLFTITTVDANIGGNIGTVTYNLSNYLIGSEVPGTYDSINSAGRIIPEKYFPIFNSVLKKNNFLENEKVSTLSASGYVDTWNSTIDQLRIISNQKFVVNEIIEGYTSKSQGIISRLDNFDSVFELNSSSDINGGWNLDAGFLNDNLQRIQDNHYYQNFSYSLKSKIDYDTWNDAVSTLNHTSGFKKFSDYQLESSEPNIFNPKNNEALSATIDVITDIIGYADLNCFYNFDLVRENSLEINSSVISNEMIFSNTILIDYFESIGNRVLSIDDISSQFNSNPRPTNYSEVHRFLLTDARAQKNFIYIRDKRYTSQRQLLISTLIHDVGLGHMNQYGRVETTYDMGSFDFSIDGSEGILYFYPTKYEVNDYDVTLISYNLKDVYTSVASTSFGDSVSFATTSIIVSSGTTTNISNIPTTYQSAKILVEIGANNGTGPFQFNEISIIHDGSDVQFIDYGQLSTDSLTENSSSGLGTYNTYISGSYFKLDFIPNSGIGLTAIINTIQVSIANTGFSGVGTFDLKHSRLESRSTSIASTSTPTPIVISDYLDDYDGAYFIVQASDVTNNRHQLSEVVVIDDDTETYFNEFANIETSSGIGTIGTARVGGVTQLTFTPLQNVETGIKVFSNILRYEDDDKDVVSFNNSSLETNYQNYYGTNRDIKRSFELKHKNYPIFQRYFDGTDSSIISTSSDTISIPNHFFVTGENLTYSHPGISTSTYGAIGIASTYFVGVGTTSKLPSSVYVVKVNDNKIKLAASASDALNPIPKVLNIVSVGIGETLHSFTSTNQNAKVIIAIDNLIQSPIVASAVTTTLSNRVFTTDDIIYLDNITSLFGSNLLKIGNEIMRIDEVGIGSTNGIRVRRPWLGTVVAGYSTGTLVTKVSGNYNIVDNTLNFIEAPYGNIPYGTTTNPPDERDWEGISIHSKFQGRTFLRSGESNTSNETYYKNYIFDDISSGFNGQKNAFSLKSFGSNISGLSSENAIILINDIFQGPESQYNYTLSQTAGITSVTFTGTASSITSDVNTASIPRGGIIVSVGSSSGFGYQPLISAGGTATVSAAGTISSISIGNSGSGYRQGLQTVRVGVGTSSTDILNITIVGTASINNGYITGVAITNPGVGYTFTNPPYVIFDAPLSYSNIPLVYSSSSSGIGTQATIDIVVGQGSSIIDYEIKNTGYGYNENDILTIGIGGTVGIPTTSNSNFEEFKINIQKTFTDKFTGWSIGKLQVLDNFDSLFNGKRKTFTISYSKIPFSIYAAKGSNVNVEDTLLIFVNDILQVPGEGYQFPGGSIITFTEPPKSGDTSKIIFYKGSGEIDVVYRDILETVKVGDELTIGYDSYIGQSISLQENERTVTSINSTNVLSTNPYFGPGNVTDATLLRPVTWCKQTEDMIIDETVISKSRILYEPLINPVAYLINSVGIGSTIIFVDNIKPFFNQINENSTNLDYQKNITLISQEPKVSAAATATVSIAGTISSIIISNGGQGYITNPTVTIAGPIGFGTTTTENTAVGVASITAGIVTTISITTPGLGYTTIPIVLIEPPTMKTENNEVKSYEGDFGIITGIKTTSVGVASTGIVFDFVISKNSFLRNSSITGVTTISGIQTGYYFVVYNSNVGNGVTSLNSSGSIVGVGSTFLDNVYQVASVSIAQTSAVGFGITYVAKVTVSVSNYNGLTGIGYSNFYGEFSWGKVSVESRNKELSYNSYNLRGSAGITTGTILKRTKPLGYINYVS
jgi:hypothetical protein